MLLSEIHPIDPDPPKGTVPPNRRLPPTPPPPPAGLIDEGDRRPDRSGAVWVTGAGATLLFAAATTFVAVRWDEIALWMKFAGLVVVTNVLLLVGRMLRQRLPVTGSALFHLGALLVPLDVLAFVGAGGWGWRAALLSSGVAGLAWLPLAARVERSTVLGWAWQAAGVLTALGVAATTPVPAVALLVVMAAGALVAGSSEVARRWAVVAGLMPGFAAGWTSRLPAGRGVLDSLGLAGRDAAIAAIAGGFLVGIVLTVDGVRRRRQHTVVGAWALAGLSGLSGLAGLSAPFATWLWCIVGLLVAVELAALFTRDDPFCNALLRPAATLAEGLSLLIPLAALTGVTWVREILGEDVLGGAVKPPVPAGVLLAWGLAFVVADARRATGRTWPLSTWTPAVFATTTGTVWALLLAGWPAEITAAAILSMATLVLVTRRPGAASVGLFACTTALWLAFERIEGDAGMLFVAATSLVLAAGARRHRRGSAGLLDMASIAVAWSLKLLIAGELTTLYLAAGVDLRTVCLAVVAALIIGAAVPDAVLRQGASPMVAAAAGSATLSYAGAELLGIGAGAFGLALSGVAVVLVGIAQFVSVIEPTGSVRSRRAVGTLGLMAATHAVLGLLVASAEPAALGWSLVLLGAAGAASAARHRELEVLAWVGGVIAALGVTLVLIDAEVVAADAHVAALAVLCLAVGARARHHAAISSWVAYVPGTALLGGAALAERWAGGSAWHAVVAGTVGVVAVIAGGWRRLAGPLIMGTAMLIVVTATEVLGAGVDVPTWMWLAAGGATLVGAGVAMELRGVGPVESGRRLLEVVARRYN